MDPPTYEEASLYPSGFSIEPLNTLPPPSYDASFSSPSTPPPTYGEAVTVLPDPFPLLTPPSVPTAVTSSGLITHPTAQIGVTPPIVTSQPQSTTTASLFHLRDVPGEVRCPYCQQDVTTKVTYQPGKAAWCTCMLLTAMGLICGFCLIPLMARGLQDAHHSCPQCGKHLHIHMR